MQFIDVSGTHPLGRGTFAGKGRRHVFYRCPLPSTDLRGMHSVCLGQLRQRHLLTDRFKRDLRLKLWRVVLSFLHFGPSIPL